MSYHIRPMQTGSPQVWWIDDAEAYQLGVGDPKQRIGSYFKAEPGEKIRDAIYRGASGYFGPSGEWPFRETEFSPGQYFPRMARPLDQHPYAHMTYSPSGVMEPNIVAVGGAQLSILTRQLQRICQTVHPQGKGLDAFGHDIRNLLILICTEVETHWRGVLVANSAAAVGDRLKTLHYVKLSAPMKLDHFAIAFPQYPWLPPFVPFAGWGSTGKPTQELEWYDAYNAVKHDRETEFEKATVLRLFEALSACVIMMLAQFGETLTLSQNPDFRSLFRIALRPQWSLPEAYIYPYESPTGEWQVRNYQF